MDDKVIAERARHVRDVIDDATADENEIVVLVAVLTLARTIILADPGLSTIEPLREMVDIGEQFVAILTDGQVDPLLERGSENS